MSDLKQGWVGETCYDNTTCLTYRSLSTPYKTLPERVHCKLDFSLSTLPRSVPFRNPLPKRLPYRLCKRIRVHQWNEYELTTWTWANKGSCFTVRLVFLLRRSCRRGPKLNEESRFSVHLIPKPYVVDLRLSKYLCVSKVSRYFVDTKRTSPFLRLPHDREYVQTWPCLRTPVCFRVFVRPV